MLSALHIRDFTIVDRLALELPAGMVVLTGETGAGKSILVDALLLALGGRGGAGLVRPGRSRAEVDAEFELPADHPAADWLRDRELDDEGQCLLRRTLGSDGRSRAYVNGRPAALQDLRDLGELLVDIHGQHAHHTLLKRDLQRRLLDDFGGHGALLDEVRAQHGRWRTASQALAALAGDPGALEAERELLRFQVDELEGLALGPGEVAALDEEHGRLAHAGRLLEGTQAAYQRLYEAEDLAVHGSLQGVLQELGELCEYDPALDGVRQLLDEAAIRVDEAAGELRRYADRVELDPQRLQWVEQRIADIQTLSRKHRVEPAALPERLAELAGRLAELDQGEERVAALQAELERADVDYRDAAARLSAARRDAAESLAAAVTGNMRDLGMPDGRFRVRLEAAEAAAPTPHGLDQVELQVSTNPGMPFGPLSRVASGGELSRISLAIQICTTGQGGIPTLIFDEVDVGVGGAVAEMVGRLLRQLAGERQILCVTHQPQVAALGHQHMQVAKTVAGKQTTTSIAELGLDERVEEIARMLGGLEITEQTEAHARELIGRASA